MFTFPFSSRHRSAAVRSGRRPAAAALDAQLSLSISLSLSKILCDPTRTGISVKFCFKLELINESNRSLIFGTKLGHLFEARLARSTYNAENFELFKIDGKNVSHPADLDASGDVNMEASISSDEVLRAGGFGARDDISSFLRVASDSANSEASLRDARDYEASLL